MTAPLVILNNPLIFMTKDFLSETLLKNKYSAGEAIPIIKNGVPKIIIFKLPEELIDNFISEFNNKPISKDINYPITLTKSTKTVEELTNEYSTIKDLPLFKEYVDYENEWKTNYTNSPEKPGLLYIDDEKKNIVYKTMKYLVEKLGKNILHGRSVLNVSFPVFIFDKRTLQMAFCCEQKLAPIYLTKAYFCTDKIEKLKWITTYLVSCFQYSVNQIKPFNPIIGETFQCKIGTLDLYAEQTVNHPITYNFYMKEENNFFTMYGYVITDASINVNSAIGARYGKFYIKFKDGALYRIRVPQIIIMGITMGERIFNFINKCLVEDLTNKLCAFIHINPEEPGYFSSFFKNKKTFPDYFTGKIVDLDSVIVEENGGNHKLKKNAKSYGVIEGEWTNFISFDQVEYWNMEKIKGLPVYSPEFLCPSDGSFREDLIYFIKDDQERSQMEKEKLEVRQRKDRKLRAEYKEKNKK